MLPALRNVGAEGRLFLLDGSQPCSWDSAVVKKAFTLVAELLAGNPLPDPKAICEMATTILNPREGDGSGNTREISFCEICRVNTATCKDWDRHLKSKGHKAMLRRQRNPSRGTDKVEISKELSENQPSDDVHRDRLLSKLEVYIR